MKNDLHPRGLHEYILVNGVQECHKNKGEEGGQACNWAGALGSPGR